MKKIKIDETGNITGYTTVKDSEADNITIFDTDIVDLVDKYGNYKYSIKDGKIIENKITLTSEQIIKENKETIMKKVEDVFYKIANGDITDFNQLKDFLNGE